jgi:hypothetical protein
MARITEDDIQRIYQAANEQIFKGAGYGSFYGQYQRVMKSFDKFGRNPLPNNADLTGFTFITRPKLNLSTTSLKQDRTLMALSTTDPNSLAFAIRCYLDTNFASRPDISGLAKYSAFFEHRSPFIIPLSNCLSSISGWPDPVIDTETTEGGFHSENLTFAKGSDRLAGSYDLTLSFREIQGSIILSIIYTWLKFIDLVTKGNTVAYPEDIDARRLCYTCSIYRFVVDPSKRIITKWAKATGCFPKSIPLGAAFNINENEIFISSMANYSIPFTVNKVEYMDPIIFRDFNRLSIKYNPDLHPNYRDKKVVQVKHVAEYNYFGLPYIDTDQGLNRINFYAYNSELEDHLAKAMYDLEQKIAS